MPAQLVMDQARIMQLSLPGGMIYNYWLRLMARVDARAKFLASGVVVGVQTGNLRASHTPPTVTGDGRMIVGRLANIASYARWVHNGTSPHDIVANHLIKSGPRAGQPGYLRFTPSSANIAAGSGGGRSSDGSGAVFRARVHHPGTQPRPWLLMAAEQVAAAPGI